MREVREEISDLLSSEREDRFFCPKEARKKAMDFLARREYGQRELIRKLANKGYDREVTEQAVCGLTQDGLQSDQRFAESFVQSRIHQGKGPVRIRLDLGQRGVSEGVVEAAINESDADWRALARVAKNKKFGQRPAVDFTAKAKQMRFLQYRGFEQEHIQVAVDGD